MRWSNIFAASSLLAACDSAAPATSDRPLAEVAADVPSDLTGDLAADEGVDAAVEDLPCVRDVGTPDTSGARYGFLRFANFGRAAGSLRFVARSLPEFAPAYVEAVVREGEATEHIQTLPVAYEIHVMAAGDAGTSVTVDGAVDGGVFTDGPTAPATLCTARREPGDLVDPICSDVYFFAGCTVVLFGSERGDPTRFTHRHLQRMNDLPMSSTACAIGHVRTAHLYAEGPALDTDAADGGVVLSRNSTYRETSGIRSVPIGPLRVSVRESEARSALGEHPAGVVQAGLTHTLYLWGDRLNPTQPGVSALLLNDVSPTFR